MYCLNCGAEIPDNTSMCPKCGALTSKNVAPASSGTTRAPKSIGGFICSLLGFLLDWFPVVGLILSIVGLAMCSNGKKIVRPAPQSYSNGGLLTAGYVLGIIGLVLSSIVLIVTLVWGIVLGNGFFSYLKAVSQLI